MTVSGCQGAAGAEKSDGQMVGRILVTDEG
jgi:hypothetical protein